MRLGICIKGFWNDDLFDIELLGRGCWKHSSCEYISGLTEDYFDFNEDHIADWLIKHPYSWGIYLPETILLKLYDKIDRNNEWVVKNYNWIVNEITYNGKFKTQLKTI